jgi:DNA polymerase III subunit delta'
MSLPPILGHADSLKALARAAATGELAGALLFHGTPGIGKQRLALWLGQFLLCEAPTMSEPCGRCAHCRLALRLEHPDLHWFFPLPRPKGASGPERLAEALEEARAAELATRRAEPYRALGGPELAGYFLSQMQRLKTIAGARPAMARRKVIVIGDAEQLVPQESSHEAANALLKLLEEPPSDTTLVLTAAEPDGILPTIRSRLMPVRLQPLPTAELAAFLEARGQAADHAAAVARLAGGSIGAALAYLPVGDEPGPREAIRQQARAWLAAALGPTGTDALALAIAQPPSGARGGFTDVLAQFTLWLRDLAATAAGAEDVVVNVDALRWLQESARRAPAAVQGVPAAIAHVESVAEWTQFNINPQLALAWLLRQVRGELLRGSLT